MENCTALIVEDDESVRQLLEVVVRKYCTAVESAPDGEEAVRLLQSGKHYEVVILDIMLPKANGFAVAEVVHGLPSRPRLIVLSAISRYFRERFPPETIILQKPFELNRLDQALLALHAI